MAKIYYKGRDYSRAIGGSGGGGGSVDSTDIPTAGKVSEFDNNAHINSEDMSSQDVEDFLADINAQGTPSEYQKLLWTNPNPTSAFAPQTISLDLSNYDAVDVEFRHWTNKDCRVTTRNYLNEGEGVGIGTSTDSTSYGNYRRGFKMYTNGVQFWGGTSNANIDNNSTIPVRIWGIKFERVAPPQVEYPNYSTEEQQVGTWVTGKPLYRKVFQYANMPNNTTAVYAHNISNMDIVVRYTCCWWDSNDGRFLMSPRDDSSTIKIRCSINKTNIVFEAIGTNWSTRTNNVNVIVEYTKTTD